MKVLDRQQILGIEAWPAHKTRLLIHFPEDGPPTLHDGTSPDRTITFPDELPYANEKYDLTVVTGNTPITQKNVRQWFRVTAKTIIIEVPHGTELANAIDHVEEGTLNPIDEKLSTKGLIVMHRIQHKLAVKLEGREKGKRALVCGCGPSLSKLGYDGIERLSIQYENAIVIGVNDSSQWLSPEYLVVIDSHAEFVKMGRYEQVIDTRAHSVIGPETIRRFAWRHKPELYVCPDEFHKMGKHKRIMLSALRGSTCSPHAAACLAEFMGCTSIDLIGVDLTDSKHPTHGRISDINLQFAQMSQRLTEAQIPHRNLNPNSEMSAWPT